MDIKKFLILILSVLFGACTPIHIDTVTIGLKIFNESDYGITVEWETESDSEKLLIIPAGRSKTIKPTPVFNSATITFEDGKMIQYTKQDKGRSLCNMKCYEKVPRSIDYGYTITNDDHDLATTP